MTVEALRSALAIACACACAVLLVAAAPSPEGSGGSQSPAPLAALTVLPKGAIEYDITSGVTLLPQGGTVIDKGTGVRLEATELRYVDGEYIRAQGAKVSGSLGTLRAQRLDINVPSATLDASGDLLLEREGLSLAAASMHYDVGEQLIEFLDCVGVDAPAFKAERLLLDTRTGNALLVGTYSYQNGILTLTSPEAGGMLQLTLTTVDGAPAYDATTKVSPDVLARFAAVLN